MSRGEAVCNLTCACGGGVRAGLSSIRLGDHGHVQNSAVRLDFSLFSLKALTFGIYLYTLSVRLLHILSRNGDEPKTLSLFLYTDRA